MHVDEPRPRPRSKVSTDSESLIIRGEGITAAQVYDVAVLGRPVALDPKQVERVAAVFERVQEWGAQKRPIYGVNTGFGELIHMIVPPRFKAELQHNLVRSHAAGGGDPFPEGIVRAIMAVRLNCLMKGYSGVSSAVVRRLAEFLNRRVHPVIPEQGSLGASGDLAPLSHMALTIIGEGQVTVDGRTRNTREVLAGLQMEPLTLGYKEGLALVNGTSAMTGAACIAITRARHLLRLAVVASAYVVQCMRASTAPFKPRGHDLKNHAGQKKIARAIARLLGGNNLTQEHQAIMDAITTSTGNQKDVADSEVYLQNAYSLRCMPQVLGAVLDSLDFCQRIIEEEVNSCNDNPLIFDSAEECFHGANFHGQYVAMAADFLNVALAEIGVLAERQLNRLVDPHLNEPLPPFLAYAQTGLVCGFEGGQYLATSIASENLDLAAPSSIKSLPSNGSNQDVVSMGLIGARKSLRLVKNVESIVSVLVAACHQATSFIGAEAFSAPIRDLHAQLSRVAGQYQDRVPFNEYLGPIATVLTSDALQRDLAASVDIDSEGAPQWELPT